MSTITLPAVPYADLCALRPRPFDVEFFLRSAGLRYEYATAEEIAWAEREALEEAVRAYLIDNGYIELGNLNPFKS